MTENKRYSIIQDGDFHTVRDTVENKPMGIFEFKENEFGKYACFHMIIDKLNELNDEKNELKRNYDLCVHRRMNDHNEVHRLEKENKELKEENEQLKKQLECSREEADDYCEELMGKDEFVRLYKRQRDDALKENEQLKSDNNRLVNETAEIVSEHQSKVLDLIDNKVEELERRYKFGQGVYHGCPMHNIRFGINVLKELKKELTE